MESLPKLITKEEIIDKFKDEKQYSNWIALKLKSKIYKKIRNNLYALIDQFYAAKILKNINMFLLNYI